MIRADGLSYMYTIMATLIAVYMATFEMGVLILFPVILLISGVALQIYFTRKVEADTDMDVSEAGSILFYTIAALAVIAVSSFFIASLPRIIPKFQLTGFDTALFAALMAIAEEQFFRGAVTSFLLIYTVPTAAIIGSGAIFTVYHLAVYGTNASALLYVFVAGVVLAWVAYRSGRLSPSMTAHLINNILASVV